MEVLDLDIATTGAQVSEQNISPSNTDCATSPEHVLPVQSLSENVRIISMENTSEIVDIILNFRRDESNSSVQDVLSVDSTSINTTDDLPLVPSTRKHVSSSLCCCIIL